MKEYVKRYINKVATGWKLFLLLAAVSCPFLCVAQIELSNGIEMSYPLLLNKENSKINYNQISFGIRAGIAYHPSNTQFFPVLNLSFGRTKLPLKQLEDNVAVINFNYLDAMINENYVINFRNSQLFIYGGIGVSFLFQEGLALAGKKSDTKDIHLDSTANTNRAFPAINLGVEYIYGESVNRRLYLSLGLNFQYILLLKDRNTYYATVQEATYTYNSFRADLTGNVITPGFFISLHYLVGPKHSSMYIN